MKVSKQSMKLQTVNEIVTVHLQVVRAEGQTQSNVHTRTVEMKNVSSVQSGHVTNVYHTHLQEPLMDAGSEFMFHIIFSRWYTFMTCFLYQWYALSFKSLTHTLIQTCARACVQYNRYSRINLNHQLWSQLLQ